MAAETKRVILKLSGEALGENGRLFRHEAFEAAARMLIRVRQSGAELAVVIGGGNVWRGRRGPAQRMGAVAADQMGMLATLQNSLYMRDTLERLGAEATVMSAVDVLRFADAYNATRARQLLKQGQILLLACGTGNPFFSTDSAVVLRIIAVVDENDRFAAERWMREDLKTGMEKYGMGCPYNRIVVARG